MKHEKIIENQTDQNQINQNTNPNFNRSIFYENNSNCGDNSNTSNCNSFIHGVLPSQNQDDFILQNVISSSEFLHEPIIDFHNALINSEDQAIESFYSPILGLPNRTGHNNQTIYNAEQQQFKLETETPSPLHCTHENRVNLDETSENRGQSPDGNYITPIASSPLLVLSILPWTGPYNFRINIPEPSLLGVKPKWCFSKLLNRIYVAKNVAFPINIMLDTYPVGAHLNICPVYNKSSNRMTPVHRCPNCRLSDPNQESCQHVIQIEGSSAYYYEQEDRFMVSTSLGTPAPGDSLINMFLKVCCNTSCTGGPNRRTFSILISLKLGENEYGRQIIDVKCCEGPTRDMNREEKNHWKGNILQPVNQKSDENLEKVREIASEVAKTKCGGKSSLKRKETGEQNFVQNKKESLEMEMVMIPKAYVKRVKKYVNMLYVKDQMRRVYPQYYSNNKVFKTSTTSTDTE